MVEKKDSGCRFCRWACDNAAKISNYIITPCKWVLDKIRQATYYAFYKIFLLGFVLVLLISGGIFMTSVKLYGLVDDYVLNCPEQSLKPKIKCPPTANTEKDSDKQQFPVDTNTGGISYEEKIIGLSNIRRNYFILFFAIFAGGLATWARFAHHQQLKHTEKQMEISRFINRNDRFAKAAEMLGEEDLISHKGGLYMLYDLVEEGPETEYIRCVEIIAQWLKGKEKDVVMRQMAVNILFARKMKNLSTESRDSIVEKFIEERELSTWPDFQSANFGRLRIRGVNLQSAFLLNANFEKADMVGAKLANAFIGGAKMKTATGLTKEQILSAAWQTNDGVGEVPELPDELMQDPDVKKWLKKSPPSDLSFL